MLRFIVGASCAPLEKGHTMVTTKAIIGSVVLITGVTVMSGACSSGNKDTSGDAGLETNEAGQVINEAGIVVVEGGVKVDNDAGVQCGRNSTLCPDGAQCAGSPDCASSICTGGVCVAPSSTCTNGAKDGTETDVDCGGGACPACPDNKKCNVADDCIDQVCTGGICQPSTCTDTVKNGTETGTDCGGATCPACATGQGCAKPTDCISDVCTADLCVAATCTDKTKNGDETDVDCGGSCATKCPVGEGCKTTADCAGTLCDVGKTNKCLPPTDTDDLQDGNETDIDCGSSGGVAGATNTGAPPCAVGKKCVMPVDCTVNACDYTGHCPVAPSCAPHWGGDTCGEGETGSGATGNENHESCCASIPLAGNTVKLDKYEITAGRMREFLSRVNNDVYDWYQTWKAANPSKIAGVNIRTVDEQYLPTGLTTPFIAGFTGYYDSGGNRSTPYTGRTFGTYDHVGNTVFFSDEPSDVQGCYVGSDQYDDGHPVFWYDAATQSTEFGAAPRAYTQQQLDEKSLNCVTQILLAAFCAWDGGRLPTTTELYGNAVGSGWGTGSYPWGSTSPNTAMVPPAPYAAQYAQACADNLNGTQNCNSGVYDALMPLNDGSGNAYLVAPQYNMTNWNPFYPFLPSGLRYYYPPAHGNLATGVGNCPGNGTAADGNSNCGWGQNDEVYEIAAPGRFINDKRPNPNPGAAGTGLDGWFDLAANMMEAANANCSAGSCPLDSNHDNIPYANWMGGSFEGHGIARTNFQFNILTKYGKMGGRCAR